jgi:hypothetical protein
VRQSLGSYYSGYFKMPDIHRQNLTQIEDVILTELKPKRYHLACQGVVYDRVEDIPKDAGSTITLVVYTHEPCLRLKFARSWSEMYVEENSEAIDPAVRKISEIVRACERRTLWKLSKLSIWMAPLLGFGGTTLVVQLIFLGHLPLYALYWALGGLALASIWWATGYRFSLFRYSRICLNQP